MALSTSYCVQTLSIPLFLIKQPLLSEIFSILTIPTFSSFMEYLEFLLCRQTDTKDDVYINKGQSDIDFSF